MQSTSRGATCIKESDEDGDEDDDDDGPASPIRSELADNFAQKPFDDKFVNFRSCYCPRAAAPSGSI